MSLILRVSRSIEVRQYPGTNNCMEWWNSITRMRRVTRALTVIAGVSAIVGLMSWPVTLSVAILAAVLSTTAVLCAAFAWFRLEHLREVERFR